MSTECPCSRTPRMARLSRSARMVNPSYQRGSNRRSLQANRVRLPPRPSARLRLPSLKPLRVRARVLLRRMDTATAASLRSASLKTLRCGRSRRRHRRLKRRSEEIALAGMAPAGLVAEDEEPWIARHAIHYVCKSGHRRKVPHRELIMQLERTVNHQRSKRGSRGEKGRYDLTTTI